ncbi:tRNA (adenosine(37)-N6)-dimethylallyltransferase MiaA [Alphaproteobacteria bacterium]|nr:tRNA (adenosine(37)-N6)-dimethylallyltransferase MiaA [Alphaproteobacteria bacterium]
MMPHYDMICLAGPTASGKSGLAVAIAQQCNGAIINADSMQVYAGIPIISAAPDETEQNGVPHYLFGQIDPAQRYSQADWLKAATDTVASIRANGQIPILVGGTGFYFKAATEGIVPMPDISSDVKVQAQAMLNEAGNQGLHARLAEIDPDLAARLEPGDSQRVLRGMEIWLASHIPLSKWQKGVAKGRLLGRPLSVNLRPPRDVLYRKINSRFEQMVEHGAIDEISALHARKLDETLPAMKAVGVRPILDMLKNIINKEKAIELAQRDSRRYAKRQFTWFDHQYNADVVIDYFPEDEHKERAIHTVLSNFQKEFV